MTSPHPPPEERYEAAYNSACERSHEDNGVDFTDLLECEVIAALREAEAAGEARGFERAARYLERQPPFGDGAWAARHVRNCARAVKESSND